ncbi:MAG: GAF domain-containing protein [Anaerolineales bacterium]|nr:GAF domain-containing protein [Anaerolineales bacterium]
MTKKNKVKGPRAARSLTATLSTAMLVLSLFAAIVTFFTQFIFYTQAGQRLTNAEQHLIAEQAANSVAGFVQEKFSELETIVQVDDLMTVSAKERESIFESMLGLDAAFRQLSLLDKQGRELTNASRLPQADSGDLQSRVEADLMDKIQQDGRYIGPVYIDKNTSEPLVILAVPAIDIFGDVKGALLAEVNLKFMWELVGGLKVGEAGIAYVVDRQGSLIAAGDVSRVLRGENLGSLDIVGEFINNTLPADQVVISSEYLMRGGLANAVLGTYVPLGEPDWAVVTEIPIIEVISPLFRNIGVAVLAMLITLTIIGFVSANLSRRLAQPVVDLTDTATRIAGGETQLQATVSGALEVATLATAFNSMTAQLRDFIVSLEQRVAARTRALATSSEVSRRLSTILNRKELVIEVVEQVKAAFGYYHAHIYLLEGDELVMAGGTGDAGAAMLADGHKLPKGRGLVGRAAESNETVLVPDTTQDPDWLPNPLLPDTRSEAAVPILVGTQVLGVLDVQHDVPDGLGQEDVDALQSIANQVAVAMQNIAQYEKTQKVAADLGVVASVGIAASSITEADRLLQEVVDLSKQSFGLYHAHIYLLNESGDTLKLASGAGEVGRQMVAEGRAIPLDSEKSLVARAARTREGVVVNDVRTDPDFLPNPLLPETRAEMAVPMLVSGKVIGVLDVQAEQVNRFTDTDVNIQTTLASQVAVALENARSLALAQKQAERETTLNTIAQKIQSTATIKEAMQIAARELGHALGMRQTLVALDTAALDGDGKGVVIE